MALAIDIKNKEAVANNVTTKNTTNNVANNVVNNVANNAVNNVVNNVVNNTTNNVVKFNGNTVYEHVYTFFKKMGNKSENTKIAYEQHVSQFFLYIRNKNMNELTKEDFMFSLTDLSNYQSHLMEKYSNSSVNQKMISIKSFLNYMRANKFNVDMDMFDLIDKLPEHDSISYGILQWDEVLLMAEQVKTHKKGQMKSVLIKLGAILGFRLDAILNLRWSNFEYHKGIWVVSTVDKGKRHTKSIHQYTYNEIIALRDKNAKDDDLIFKITPMSVSKMIKVLCEEINIDKEKRNITFHSLKKCGIGEAYLLSNKDILVASQQGNHSSPTTTMRYYMQQQQDPTKCSSLLIGMEMDFTKIENLSKEQLVQLIKKCDRHTQISIFHTLQSTQSTG